LADQNGCESNILKAVQRTNKNQINIFLDKVYKYFNNDVSGKTFALWGLAFKPKTNDMREAPAIKLINALLEKGAHIRAYDPKAFDSARIIFGDKIEYVPSSYAALENSDALLLVTEWNEFRRPDFERIKKALKNPVIFDGRNQYDEKRLAAHGIKYFRMGHRDI